MRPSFLRKALTTTIAVSLVLLAVVFSLARLLIVYAPDFRAELEATLSEVLQRPLTLGGLHAQWVGRHPSLVLEDVRLLGDGPARGLRVDELKLNIDLLASLRDRQLRLAEVTVRRLPLRLAYGADGGLRLTHVGEARFNLDAGGGSLPELPATVHLAAASVEIQDLASGEIHRFPQLDLWLSDEPGGHSLSGYLDLPPALGHSARFRAEWQGAPGQGPGRLYLDARELEVGALSALLGRRFKAVPALAGRASGELWLAAQGTRVERVSGRLNTLDLRVADGESLRSLAAHLKGEFDWRREDEGWRLDTGELDYASEQRVWPASRLHLQHTRVGGVDRLTGRTDYLRLDDLAPALAALPRLPVEVRDRLRQLAPVGELRSPSWSLAWDSEGVRDYRLSLDFKGLGVSAVGLIPRVAGLDGTLSLDASGGVAALESHRAELEFPRLFRGPIPVRSLRTQLSWWVDEDGWRLEAPLLKLENEDARALARLRLISSGAGLPFIDLRAQLSDGNGAMTSRYLPAAIMSEPLTNWLDGAVRGGRVERADLMLFGPLSGFPYKNGGGVFDVQARVVDARLDYRPDWPGITGIAGQLRFHADTMEITASEGLISGARVEAARVALANFSGAPLDIAGRVRGDGEALLGFLRNSPLGTGIAGVLSELTLGGRHRVRLEAAVPIIDGGAPRVRGRVELGGGALAAPALGLSVEELAGVVSFSERGVEAKAVEGRFHGQPLRVDATTARLQGRERIRVSTRVSGAPHELLGLPPRPEFAGAADWDVSLLLPGFQDAVGADSLLSVASDLRGLAIEMPAPLGKPAAAARQLRIEAGIDADGLRPLEIFYADTLRARLALDEAFQPQRLALRLGGGEPRLASRPGVTVDGSLAELDLDAWRSQLQPGGGPGEDAAAAMPLLGLDLQVGTLRMAGQAFSDIRFELGPSAQGWEMGFSGQDIAGQALLPRDPAQTAQISLQRLHLQPPGANGEAAKSPPGRGMDLPSLDLFVENLSLGERQLGRLQLDLRRVPLGVRLQSGRLEGPYLDARATGGWSQDGSESRLDIEVSSVNAGRTLTQLGYDETLEGGLAEGMIALRWPGGPTDFDPSRLSGEIDLSVSNGRVLAVEPGAGRLFGLLSIAELPRRLSLNFSDLFGEGFAFSRIEAHLTLNAGNAYTRLFYMEGPAARVDLDGRIGLGSRDYDQQVTVTPHVSSALPAIGAITGGPAGAAVMFITQKLLEKQLNKLGRYSYRVTGSWDAPEIEPLQEPPSA